MKLPNGDHAIVDDQKLHGYLLNPLHREGKKHAEMFKRLLDVDLNNADILRRALLTAAAKQEAWVGKKSPYGDKYEVRFQMTGQKGQHIILSVWMIRIGETSPRLVTAYIE